MTGTRAENQGGGGMGTIKNKNTQISVDHSH